jgi:hypothetical protein
LVQDGGAETRREAALVEVAVRYGGVEEEEAGGGAASRRKRKQRM